MIDILIYFFLAISLSIDAFSISLSLGTLNPKKSSIIFLSIIIGLFHFIMPLLGYLIGINLFNKIPYQNIITFIILIIISYEMYHNKDESTNLTIFNLLTIITIAFTVSIDSFTVGMAFCLTNNPILSAIIIFSLTSSFFTYCGLTLGKKINTKYHNQAIYLGITIMILVAFKYLLFS